MHKTSITMCLIIAFFIVFAQTAYVDEENDTENNVITIGHASPLSGDNAYIGVDQLRGAQIAVDEVNKRGGILGRKVVLVAEDDAGNPTEAANVAHRFCNMEELYGVVGHLNSHCSMPASPIYSECSMPMLTPVSTTDKLTTRGLTNVFRVCIRNSDQAPALADFAVNVRKYKRIAVVHDNQDFGKDIAEQFRLAVGRIDKGTGLLEAQIVDPQSTNYRSVVAIVKAGTPDAVFFGGMARQGALLIKQAREMGLNVPFIGGDGIYSEELIDRAGLAAEGTIVSHIAPMEPTDDNSRVFFDACRAKYGEGVRAYAPIAYDATMALLKAIEKSKGTSRKAVIQALHDEAFDYTGITGRVSFDKAGERLSRKPYLYEISGGKFRLVK